MVELYNNKSNRAQSIVKPRSHGKVLNASTVQCLVWQHQGVVWPATGHDLGNGRGYRWVDNADKDIRHGIPMTPVMAPMRLMNSMPFWLIFNVVNTVNTSVLMEIGILWGSVYQIQAAKCKWRALRHTCLLLLSVLGGMPASHQGMQARLFFCGRYLITVMHTEMS